MPHIGTHRGGQNQENFFELIFNENGVKAILQFQSSYSQTWPKFVN